MLWDYDSYKTEFEAGCMNLRILLLKTENLSNFLRPDLSCSIQLWLIGKKSFEKVEFCV